MFLNHLQSPKSKQFLQIVKKKIIFTNLEVTKFQLRKNGNFKIAQSLILAVF